MSTTTTINPVNSGNPADGKKNAAAFAATAASAAGLGVAGTHIISEFEDANSDTSEGGVASDSVIEETVQSNSGNANTNTATTAASSTSASSPSPSSSTISPTNSSVEPQPITNADVAEPIVEPVSVVESNETSEPGLTVEPDVAIEPDVTVETEEVEPPTTGIVTDEAVNPDGIAEAIISEEKIDPNDIDMEDIVNFDEIETVYTVDGQSITAASFHDGSGNNLIMIDVDGDDVFDLITDYDGNFLAEVPGNLSVGDAQ